MPIGRDIDGKYLQENVNEIKKEMEKWRRFWPEYGVTIMCDSWTGPTRKSVINFLLYCNGTMYFWKSIDATGVSQDHQFILKVCGWCGVFIFLSFLKPHAYRFFENAGDQESSEPCGAREYCSDRHGQWLQLQEGM